MAPLSAGAPSPPPHRQSRHAVLPAAAAIDLHQQARPAVVVDQDLRFGRCTHRSRRVTVSSPVIVALDQLPIRPGRTPPASSAGGCARGRCGPAPGTSIARSDGPTSTAPALAGSTTARTSPTQFLGQPPQRLGLGRRTREAVQQRAPSAHPAGVEPLADHGDGHFVRHQVPAARCTRRPACPARSYPGCCRGTGLRSTHAAHPAAGALTAACVPLPAPAGRAGPGPLPLV